MHIVGNILAKTTRIQLGRYLRSWLRAEPRASASGSPVAPKFPGVSSFFRCARSASRISAERFNSFGAPQLPWRARGSSGLALQGARRRSERFAEESAHGEDPSVGVRQAEPRTSESGSIGVAPATALLRSRLRIGIHFFSVAHPALHPFLPRIPPSCRIGC